MFSEDPENTENLQFKRRRWSADSIRLLVPHLLSGEAYNLLKNWVRHPKSSSKESTILRYWGFTSPRHQHKCPI